MTNEEILPNLEPFFQPDFTEQDKAKACDYFREISKCTREQVAVLMAMQHGMVMKLVKELESPPKIHKAHSLPRQFRNGH